MNASGPRPPRDVVGRRFPAAHRPSLAPAELSLRQDFELEFWHCSSRATLLRTTSSHIARSFNLLKIHDNDMARSKLKSALDNEKGRNFKLERQRKQEKEARKRKEQNKPEGDDESEAEGGVALDEVELKVLPKSNGKVKKGKVSGVKAAAPAEEAEWETDDSENEDGSDNDEVPFDLSRLEDSESDVSGDDEEDEEVGETLGAGGDDEDEEDDVEDEDEDDIAFSDIESLTDEDKADIVPHQRLTINNTAALTAALNRIRLPYSKLGFSEHMSLTTDEDVEIADVDDDLNRELAFYKQSLSAVKDARGLLKKEGAPFSRPADYFAEMVKDDEHMGKIKQKLMDEAAGKKASAEARKQRDLKKFGKQVQVAKLQERAKEKRDTLDKISQLKRSTFSFPLPYPFHFNEDEDKDEHHTNDPRTLRRRCNCHQRRRPLRRRA